MLSVADHLSRLHIPGGGDIGDTFPDDHLLAISSHAPWYAHIVNFIVTESIPGHWNRHKKDKFLHDLKYYFWEEPLLFRLGYDQIIRRCIPKEEQGDILAMCHSSTCKGDIRSLGIGFMGPFLPSNEKEYILVAVDYVSKWVKAMSTRQKTIRRC